mmetsp:Transcript_22883/g.22157  ORF Transcript_22883/g.22157 Transcript_22883/m.22157 type:complete len:145 (-) Transcript_22883:1672-2106(-)
MWVSLHVFLPSSFELRKLHQGIRNDSVLLIGRRHCRGVGASSQRGEGSAERVVGPQRGVVATIVGLSMIGLRWVARNHLLLLQHSPRQMLVAFPLGVIRGVIRGAFGHSHFIGQGEGGREAPFGRRVVLQDGPIHILAFIGLLY